jgi:hypothetical protein
MKDYFKSFEKIVPFFNVTKHPTELFSVCTQKIVWLEFDYNFT